MRGLDARTLAQGRPCVHQRSGRENRQRHGICQPARPAAPYQSDIILSVSFLKAWTRVWPSFQRGRARDPALQEQKAWARTFPEGRPWYNTKER